jgi:proline iminopeptidase
VADGTFLLCPNGSHLCRWDDREVFMAGVAAFVDAVE